MINIDVGQSTGRSCVQIQASGAIAGIINIDTIHPGGEVQGCSLRLEVRTQSTNILTNRQSNFASFQHARHLRNGFLRRQAQVIGTQINTVNFDTTDCIREIK